MRGIFQQKYILRALASLALALPVINILNWKISEYRLRDAPFQLSHPPEPNLLLIFISSAFFLCLVFTKRIILSFLTLFLFCFQIFLAVRITSYLSQSDYYFSYPESLYFETALTACNLALSFWLAVFVCRFCNQKFQSEIFMQ